MIFVGRGLSAEARRADGIEEQFMSTVVLSDEGANPNARQQDGFAPLHEAVFNDNRRLAELLLEHGADPEQANEAGESPLGLARAQGRAELLSLLHVTAPG